MHIIETLIQDLDSAQRIIKVLKQINPKITRIVMPPEKIIKLWNEASKSSTFSTDRSQPIHFRAGKPYPNWETCWG